METNRLRILKESLRKKQEMFNSKLSQHFDTVKQSNGQPLNDKRNGQATLNKWERQNDALRKLDESIEKTKQAIEREEGKIIDCESARQFIPNDILRLVDEGTLKQWRKHPTIFFVEGVEKARIQWDEKKKVVTYSYLDWVTDKEQFKKFASIYNELHKKLNK